MSHAHSALRVDAAGPAGAKRYVISKFGGYVPAVPEAAYHQPSVEALAMKKIGQRLGDPPQDTSMYTTSSLAAQDGVRQLHAKSPPKQHVAPMELVLHASSQAIGTFAPDEAHGCINSSRARHVPKGYAGHRPGDKGRIESVPLFVPPVPPGEPPRTLHAGFYSARAPRGPSVPHPLEDGTRLPPQGGLPPGYSGTWNQFGIKNKCGPSHWAGPATERPQCG